MLHIAIDGNVASGKDTIAYALAQRLGAIMIETGSLFRAAAWQLQHSGVSEERVEQAMGILRETDFQIHYPSLLPERKFDVLVDGRDITSELRTHQIAMKASFVARTEALRKLLIEIKKKLAEPHPRLVMTGRGIGRMVLPNAQLKLYLTAKPEVRAQRRLKDRQQADPSLTLGQVLAEINERDRVNRERAFDPDVPTEDAVVLDTSDLSVEGVVDEVMKKLEGKKDLLDSR